MSGPAATWLRSLGSQLTDWNTFYQAFKTKWKNSKSLVNAAKHRSQHEDELTPQGLMIGRIWTTPTGIDSYEY